MCCEEILGGSLSDTMWKWEFEVLAEKLLDVGTLDVLGAFELDNFEDLRDIVSMLTPSPHRPKSNIHAPI